MKKLLFLILMIVLSAPVLSDVAEITIEYGESDCTESWSCTDWSACTSGTQARTCTDSNDCGTAFDKPSESQSCYEEDSQEDDDQNSPSPTEEENEQTKSSKSEGSGGGGGFPVNEKSEGFDYSWIVLTGVVLIFIVSILFLMKT